MKTLLPIVFALSTGFFWGTYGPVLAQARAYEKSPFKPYVMIGVAYLIWGIIGGVVGMISKGDSFSFSKEGTYWGFAAGSLGAWGALTLTLAMYTGGTGDSASCHAHRVRDRRFCHRDCHRADCPKLRARSAAVAWNCRHGNLHRHGGLFHSSLGPTT